MEDLFGVAKRKEQHLEIKIKEFEDVILGAKEVLGREDMGIKDLKDVEIEDLGEEHLSEYAS